MIIINGNITSKGFCKGEKFVLKIEKIPNKMYKIMYNIGTVISIIIGI